MGERDGVPADVASDRASAIAAEVEASGSTGGLSDFAQTLANRTVGEDAETTQFLIAEAHIYGQWVNVWQKEPPAPGVPPYPNLEPERLPDTARDYIRRRVAETHRQDLRARLLDVMWLRWGDHLDARSAHAAYLALARAADLQDVEANLASVGWLVRASQISMQLNHDRAATATEVCSEIRRGLPFGVGRTGFTVPGTIRLLETAPDEAQRLAEDLRIAAQAAGDAKDRWRQQSLLEACVLILRAIGDAGEAEAAMAAKAASLEAQAAEVGSGSNAGAGLAYLSEAAQIYRDLGRTADAHRLKKSLSEAGRATIAAMGTFSVETQIDMAQVEAEASRLRCWNDNDPRALLWLPFELGVWPRWSTIEALKATLAVEAPLASMISHVRFEGDARYQPEPADPAERERARVANLAAQQILLHCGLLPMKIALLRRRGRWTVDRVIAALSVGDGQADQNLPGGLLAFEAADYWTSLHVLIPQLERFVRLIGLATGGNVHAYTQGGGLRWKPLEDLLDEPSVRAVITDDVARDLNAVFTGPHGPNLRNNLAHGALDHRDAGEPASVATLMALLALTLLMVAARSQAEEVDREEVAEEAPTPAVTPDDSARSADSDAATG